ncbi:hypothetical protein LS73_006625 [Helicobacter muridarum]|uniref:Uncharacterized protein n=1 Tax=Helicobacter muridarum TaxID=216 RepID=A0A377PWJ9_9HELI|nr:hypothetical protein [Helicobacter muridarum]TLD99854.1 hypothetical protein LS73_006625 [Helicobacter muridarum]STQ86937.1 Uncharacterised protein [Helicobacter muridarum]
MTQNEAINKNPNVEQKYDLVDINKPAKDAYNPNLQNKTNSENSSQAKIESHANYIKKHNIESIFQKTQIELDKISNLSIFNEKDLEKGLKFKSINIEIDSIFFKMYIGSTLYLACAYNHIIDERTFSKNPFPALHFSKCQEIQAINPNYLKICIPKINAFDYRVRSNGVDTRLFYEHPLKICPFCIISLCKVLEKKYNKEVSPNSIKQDEILNAIFKNTLKDIVL